MKTKILILGILVAFVTNFVVSAQDPNLEREKYYKLGFVVRTFNNSSLKEDIGGEFLGFEGCWGVEVQKNLTAELNTSMHWKKLDEGEKFRYREIGVLFDYRPSDFYLGIGPALASLETQYKVVNNNITSWDSYSDYAIGFSGRIGYIVHVSDKFNLYAEFKYSKINIEDDGEKIDVGTAGVSIGLKF
ncbi:MAG: outer membrane beta-barrel protein [Nanoarchaeota archaeon]